ncbi:TetR/AcrR family transcriptional regulator [Rhodococcus sovatensis]|uniref:TetR/AcrR family transcriptional regulator n=1 Tax=Rhodococcus sovatensis TaxID=1805840 RepID=A0ABZ2PN18_9NOCA
MAHTSSDHRISAAALQLLRSGGPRSATIEGVAALSGVAKTTIYRRYRNRREMLTAALAPISDPPRVDMEMDPRDQLRSFVHYAAGAVHAGIGFGGLAALLVDDDPEFCELFRDVLAEHRSHLSAAIRAAIDSELIRRDIPIDTLVDSIVGTYAMEQARTGRIEAGWEDRIVALLFPEPLPVRC